MKRENLFYLIFVLTILIVRISVITMPEFHIIFSDMLIHHFWFGIILLLVGLIMPKNKEYPKIFLYGIGAGLIIDQLVFMILGAGRNKEYWALPSLLGAIIITFIIFPIRQKLTNFLLQKSIKIY